MSIGYGVDAIDLLYNNQQCGTSHERADPHDEDRPLVTLGLEMTTTADVSVRLLHIVSGRGDNRGMLVWC
ncbi:hypothetical protein [Bradyrhizobium ottawaense]|uniref:hypothetical protein n=1 Tax=Bradyrhizobium ottawaense TaxID=931866 RepID=UPI001038C1A2|nr:hypothetical protein [Bradyrhizobium ottawaense]